MKNAKMLALKGMLLLLLFWGISLGIILLLPMAFPHLERLEVYFVTYIMASSTRKYQRELFT